MWPFIPRSLVGHWKVRVRFGQQSRNHCFDIDFITLIYLSLSLLFFFSLSIYLSIYLSLIIYIQLLQFKKKKYIFYFYGQTISFSLFFIVSSVTKIIQFKNLGLTCVFNSLGYYYFTKHYQGKSVQHQQHLVSLHLTWPDLTWPLN